MKKFVTGLVFTLYPATLQCRVSQPEIFHEVSFCLDSNRTLLEEKVISMYGCVSTYISTAAQVKPSFDTPRFPTPSVFSLPACGWVEELDIPQEMEGCSDTVLRNAFYSLNSARTSAISLVSVYQNLLDIAAVNSLITPYIIKSREVFNLVGSVRELDQFKATQEALEIQFSNLNSLGNTMVAKYFSVVQNYCGAGLTQRISDFSVTLRLLSIDLSSQYTIFQKYPEVALAVLDHYEKLLDLVKTNDRIILSSGLTLISEIKKRINALPIQK